MQQNNKYAVRKLTVKIKSNHWRTSLTTNNRELKENQKVVNACNNHFITVAENIALVVGNSIETLLYLKKSFFKYNPCHKMDSNNSKGY
jgi:hypothetical protein